jgi:hypothetical protein
MSGIIGHTMYALLGARAAAERGLPVARIAARHLPSYLCGAYLGADVGTVPAAICQDTNSPVGYGAQRLAKSPLTGGVVKPWRLEIGRAVYSPRQIHDLFYGRAHLAFGWAAKDQPLAIPWEKLPEYFAAVLKDARQLHGPGERQLAYALGWMTHVIGDGMIKSVAPGLELHLLDGKYTPANRPIQDLVTFHEIGVKELKLDWPALLSDLVDCPIEPLQTHYMRVAPARGELAKVTKHGWESGRQLLLLEVMAVNRRYQRIRNGRILKQLALRKTAAGLQCDPALSKRAKGMKYPDMVALAEKANFRHALWQVGEAIADIFSEVVHLVPELKNVYQLDEPNWKTLTARWKRN